tara:strand:+ start:248 stop:547 length:300 start_codon:yes stop_codon:yes gene_type:complete
MAILDKQPLTIAEVASHVKDLDEKKVLADYLKKFSKLTEAEAKKLREDIRAMDNPKIKELDIVKVVDTLPQDAEEVNKIFTDVNLSEEEINSILEKTKR